MRTPFSDLSGSKIRPAVVIGTAHPSRDVIVVALTSRTSVLMPGEFVLSDWGRSGLNVATAVKRNIFTLDRSLAVKRLGSLTSTDLQRLEESLRTWFGI